MEDNTQLSLQLKKEAVRLGLCKQWTEAWKDNTTQQELINKFIRGYDFCLKHNWPSVDFICDNFDEDLLHKNGIIARGRYSFLNPETCIVMGDGTQATIRINGKHPSRIYLNSGTSTKIIVKTSELVIIETRGDAAFEVMAEGDYDHDIVVYDYSSHTIFPTLPDCVKYKRLKDYIYEA